MLLFTGSDYVLCLQTNMTLCLGPPQLRQRKGRHGRLHTQESSTIKQIGPTSPLAGGPFTKIDLGDSMSPQAGSLGDEVADVSQDGQVLPSSIDASQVLATVNTEDFSSSTPQGGIEEQLHPSDGDTTSATQLPRPPDLS